MNNHLDEIPPQPSDNTTLTHVLDELGASGWTGQFVAREGGAVRCTTCAAVLAARDLVVHRERRLEGASDPDDLSLVVATDCPVCGTAGTLVLSYGPERVRPGQRHRGRAEQVPRRAA